MKIEYPAKIQQEEDGTFFVSFPDISEALSEGATLEEALFNASEVLTLSIEYRLDEEQKIPDPSDVVGDNIYLRRSVLAVQLYNFS